MRFEQPLVEGTLIRRYKRFLADVKLRSGDEITVHCAHPGSMRGCSEPGSRVLVSVRDDPRRRFSHQLEIVYAGRTPVGIHTGRPTVVVTEALMHGRVPEVAGYATLQREAKMRRDDPVDIVLSGNGLRNCHICVESVTLAQDAVAYFPDTPYEAGIAHLGTLTDLVREGHRALVALVAQRCDVESFRPADQIDPDYGQALRDALARGVEAVCLRAKVTRKGIELDKQIPIVLDA